MSNLAAYRNGNGASHAGKLDLEFLALDDRLRDEMKRLSAVNDELLGKRGSDPDVHVESAAEEASLRMENAQLRQRLAEGESLLEELAASEAGWTEQKKEYEALLEEKSEVIRALHLKVQELQEGASSGAAAKAAENAEVLKLKKELAEQRRQVQEDEEALMQQMRQMEMAMSRDRAELARQRNELARMQSELNHEIEMASRDPGLRDRLLSLQRRQQDALTRKGGAAPAGGLTPAKDPEPDNAAKPSGFFRRLFGK